MHDEALRLKFSGQRARNSQLDPSSSWLIELWIQIEWVCPLITVIAALSVCLEPSVSWEAQVLPLLLVQCSLLFWVSCITEELAVYPFSTLSTPRAGRWRGTLIWPFESVLWATSGIIPGIFGDGMAYSRPCWALQYTHRRDGLTQPEGTSVKWEERCTALWYSDSF